MYTHADMMRDRREMTKQAQQFDYAGRPRTMVTIPYKFEGKHLPGPVLTGRVGDTGDYDYNMDPNRINEFNYHAGTFWTRKSDLTLWNELKATLRKADLKHKKVQELEDERSKIYANFSLTEDEMSAQIAKNHKKLVSSRHALRNILDEASWLASTLTSYGYNLATVTEKDFI